MDRFEVRITIDRPLAAVFAIYTQPDTWRWCSYIRRARWVRGNPWEEESRLRVETNSPISVPVDQVVMHFDPCRRVEYICHFGGITLQSRQDFHAVTDSVAEIHNQSEFIGSFSRVAGFAIGATIEQRTGQFLEDLKRECERVIPAQVKTHSPTHVAEDKSQSGMSNSQPPSTSSSPLA